MGLQDTISADRIHIGFFGLRNAGKSSLVNAVTGQDLAVVSEVKGTTTDPVKKAMELLPLGPVMMIDTPGLDDVGTLGTLRMEKTRKVLTQVDVAILVVDATVGLSQLDRALLSDFQQRQLPYLLAWNKADLLPALPQPGEQEIFVSAVTGMGIEALKNRIGALARSDAAPKQIAADLLRPGETVVLVVPIDSAAPKGRLILPQQQTIRDLLDGGCIPVLTRDDQLERTLASLTKPPALVITDSQIFAKVAKLVPASIPLTSFSILFARYKGELDALVNGAAMLSRLKTGDRVLICEGCTHHRQCGDIGTEKIPQWIRRFSGAEPEFSFTSGGDFPEDLSPYALIVHCGGCMLKETEMKHRIHAAGCQQIPMVNYGIAIARMHGILERCLEPFPAAAQLLKS